VTENPLAIRSFPAAADEAQTLARLIVKNSEQSLAVVSLEDDYFVGLNSILTEMVGHDRVSFSDTVSPTETDFSSILLKIRTVNPTAIFANVGPQQLKPFIKKLRELGFKQRIYSNFVLGLADVRKALGSDGEGIYYAELDYKKPQYLAAHRKQFGDDNSSPVGFSCYVGMLAMLEILHRAADSTQPLYELIGRDFDLPTADEMIEIRDREAKLSVLPIQLISGEPRVVATE
jgi:ABC-type branched-subunit amino acid transport system substrate-binding protein